MEQILIRVYVRSSDGSCNEEGTVTTIEQTETASEAGTSSCDSSTGTADETAGPTVPRIGRLTRQHNEGNSESLRKMFMSVSCV
jgi:hypothetical protein